MLDYLQVYPDPMTLSDAAGAYSARGRDRAGGAGWQPVDATARYWRHELRYGLAIFDRWEVDSIEQRGQRPRPRRASPCLCRSPYGRLEEGICWKCGRRLPEEWERLRRAACGGGGGAPACGTPPGRNEDLSLGSQLP